MTLPYLAAAMTILQEGTRKPNRTGVDTISAFAIPMQFDLQDGFPLLTTKKMSWKNILLENLWFLSGDTNIAFLRKHGVKIWDEWVDERGLVPSAYGNFWRQFPVHNESWSIREVDFNDQVEWVLDTLRANPSSRRMVVSAWDPGNAQTSKLPPCHVMWVLNVQNLNKRKVSHADGMVTDILLEETEPRLCLHLTQRSCDMFLGVPYNIAGYAFICHLMGHLAGIPPGIFSHTLVDAHFYTAKPDGSMAAGGTHGEDDNKLLDHVPLIKEQLTRQPRQLPQLTISDQIRSLDDITKIMEAPLDEILDAFRLEGYDPHPTIKGAVAV